MNLRFRYLIRLSWEFLYRFRGILLAGVLLGISLFFLIRFLFPIFFSGTTKRIGVTGRYRTDGLPDEILSKISTGLTLIGNSLEVESGIAKIWESPDKGRTWYFYLKDGIKWQDGKEVTSKDISYNFSDVSIERPDEKTLVFKLKDEYSPFPTIVSSPVFKRGLMGLGEWTVNKITLSGGFVQSLTLKNSKRDRLIYKFYPTEERTKLAFRLGQVDFLEDIYNPEPLNSWNTININAQIDKTRVATIFFNTKDKFLSDKSLRQALAYAIEKNSFEKNRAVSPISPLSWAYNPQVKPYNFYPKKAKEMISELPNEIKNDLKINLQTPSILLPVAEKIVANWKDIGVNSDLVVSSTTPQDFQAYLAILDIPADPDQYSIWHSTQGSTNISKFSSPRIDKLLEDGRAELDMEERKKIYLDFQRYLIEDSPAIFLYHPIIYEVERK